MAATDIFSYKKLISHKLRALPKKDQYNFLFEISANLIKERLKSIQKTFVNVLDYNNGETFLLSDYLQKREKTHKYIMASLQKEINPRATYYLDPESIRLEDLKEIDLFVGNLNLHWINDLPGFFMQVRKSLTTDGMFIGTCFGRATLKELRKSIYLAQNDLDLPFTNHISPFIDSESGASLLQRAGLNFKVTDSEEVTVTYSDLRSLLNDLRGMGENNNMNTPYNPFYNKNFFQQLELNYQKTFSNENQEIIATFEIILLTAAKV